MVHTYFYGLTEHCVMGSFLLLWQQGKMSADDLACLNPNHEYYPKIMRAVRGLIYSFYTELARVRTPAPTDPPYYGYVIARAFADDIFGGEDPEEFAYRYRAGGAFAEIVQRINAKCGQTLECWQLCPVGEDEDDFPIKEVRHA